MTESQYQRACDQQAWEESYIASRMEAYAMLGYDEAECEAMAEEGLQADKERSHDY